MMNIRKQVFGGLTALVFVGTAAAQIYESVDAEGNKVFTDEPVIGAEVVNLPETNTADAPPDIPEPSAAEPAQPAMAGPGNPGDQSEDGGGGDAYDDAYGDGYGEGEDWRAREAEAIHHTNRVDGPGAGVPGAGAPGHVEPYQGAVPGEDLRQVNEAITHEEIPAHEQVAPHAGGAAPGRR
jgi:hypothetical protein